MKLFRTIHGFKLFRALHSIGGGWARPWNAPPKRGKYRRSMNGASRARTVRVRAPQRSNGHEQRR